MDKLTLKEDDEELSSDELDMDFDEELGRVMNEDESKSKYANRASSIAGLRATQKYSRSTTLKTNEILTKESFRKLKKLGEGAYGVV